LSQIPPTVESRFRVFPPCRTREQTPRLVQSSRGETSLSLSCRVWLTWESYQTRSWPRGLALISSPLRLMYLWMATLMASREVAVTTNPHSRKWVSCSTSRRKPAMNSSYTVAI
jgi:hypothetical protein